jgi:hypothetical protein
MIQENELDNKDSTEEKQDSIKARIDKSCQLKEDLKVCYLKQAEIIDYRNSSESVKIIDNYGFQLKTETNQITGNSNNYDKNNHLRENARMEKWFIMLKDFESFSTSNISKLKSRTRNGVPEGLRGIVWQKFAKVAHLKSQKQNLYKDLLESKDISQSDEETILKDINRTFPKHIFFKDKYGQGQRKLFNILRSYSIFNQKIGYVQGMGFICALFLTYIDEEPAFWLLHSLMVNYNMEGLYTTNFPKLAECFYIYYSLLKKYVNKVYLHLKLYNIAPTMFASQWFLTIFTNYFNFNILVRLFDCLLLEGEKIIYRIALGIMIVNQNMLLECKSFESILNCLKSMGKAADEESLIKESFAINISKKDVKKYYLEYHDILVKRKEKNEIWSLVSY